MARRTFGPRVLLVLAVIVMTPAVAFGPLYAVGEFGRVRGIGRWPTIPGTIVPPAKTAPPGAVDYTYEVDGTVYRGRLRPELTRAEPATGGPAATGPPAAAYPVGSRHPIYVNPDDPDESYLEVGPPRVSWALVVLPPLIAVALWGYLTYAVWPRPSDLAVDDDPPGDGRPDAPAAATAAVAQRNDGAEG